MIRALTIEDIEKLKEIHQKYYSDFEFPDFSKFLCSFAVTDESNRIITGGGVKPIAESILLTDKQFSARDRRIALLQILQASMFVIGKAGYDQLHAFIKDEKWSVQLKKYGFRNCKGEALYINPIG